VNLHLAWLLALAVTVLAVFVGLRLAPQLGLVDLPDSRKKHTGSVPLVGGIAIYAGISVALVLSGQYINHMPFLAAGALIVATGVWDDIRGVSPYIRLALQAISVWLIAGWGGRYIADLGHLMPDGSVLSLGWLGIAFTVFAGVALINAFNMTDGLDGLCASLTLAALFGGMVMAASLGSHYFEVRFLSVLGAAVVGFLLFNFPFPGRGQASAFLGDAGSYLLGLSVLYSVILLTQGDNRAMPPVSALWFCLLPLLDMGGISIRRVMRRRSPFAADREHLHHVFTLAKFSPAATTGSMAAIALIGVLVGTTMVFGNIPELIQFGLFASLAGLYLWHLLHTWKQLRFLSRSIDRRVLDRRTPTAQEFRRATDGHGRAEDFEGANDPIFERRTGDDRRTRRRDDAALTVHAIASKPKDGSDGARAGQGG
jgi:UDP-GlcNAc:undecaprenyl-phosphate GlcNAc-1-phosphate transferase